MTETEKMVREVNDFLRLVGDAELTVPGPDHSTSELDYLRTAKQDYIRRLLEKVPKYKSLKSEALIPDLFLDALRRRETELEAGGLKTDRTKGSV